MSPIENLIQEHDAIRTMTSIMSLIADNLKANKGFEINDVEKIADFLTNYIDKCHHAKEETVLFSTLIAAGVSNSDNGPISVLLKEHELGRRFIRDLNDEVENCKVGFTCSAESVTDILVGYVDLLQNHMKKEEKALFPIAKKKLTEQQQKEISVQFRIIEENVVGQGVYEQYSEILNQLKNKYLEHMIS